MESHMSRFRVKLPNVARTPATPPASSERRRLSAPDQPRRRPACDRCRRLKRECSKTPQCAECAKARRRCSLRTPGTQRHGHDKDVDARLAWMEDMITRGNLLPRGQDISDISTGTPVLNIDEGDQDESMAEDTSWPQSPLQRRSSQTNEAGPSNGPDDRTAVASSPRQPSTASTPVQTTESFLQTMSPGTQHRDGAKFVAAYFRDVNRAYPFVNRSRILDSLSAKGDTLFSMAADDDDSIKLYLVMAIGYTTLQRAERLAPSRSSSTPFVVDYKDLLCRCLLRESIGSVEILLLLGIYSLFDPRGLSTWSIVEAVARQALRLGLTSRRTADEGCSAVQAEHNHRLYWAVFSLDRTMSASTGVPPALSHSDIPLPGLTVEEFSSAERVQLSSTLHLSRHIIELRILEDRALREAHLDQRGAFSQNRVAELRTAIENWYSNGCLLRSADSDDDAAIHIHISWLAARYYNLLLMVYYPSRTSAVSSTISPGELLSLARKHVQANTVRFQQRQLPLNDATLCRTFWVCHIFFYLSMRGCVMPAEGDVTMCADILAAYPKVWTVAHRAATAARQLAAWVSDMSLVTSPRSRSRQSEPVRGHSQADGAWRLAIQLRFQEPEEDILGRGSVYRCSSEWFERSTYTGDGAMSESARGPAPAANRAVPEAEVTWQPRVYGPGEGWSEAGAFDFDSSLFWDIS